MEAFVLSCPKNMLEENWQSVIKIQLSKKIMLQDNRQRALKLNLKTCLGYRNKNYFVEKGKLIYFDY